MTAGPVENAQKRSETVWERLESALNPIVNPIRYNLENHLDLALNFRSFSIDQEKPFLVRKGILGRFQLNWREQDLPDQKTYQLAIA